MAVTSRKYSEGVATLVTEYEGCVLGKGDVSSSLWESYSLYATVWDEAEGKVKTVNYWGGYWDQRPDSDVGATVDATDAVRAKAYASEYARLADKLTDEYANEAARAAVQRASRVEKGRTVKVTRGRKVKPGTEGVVFWVGESPGYSRWSGPTQRVGLKGTDGETYWVNGAYCEVLDTDPWDYVENVETVKARALSEAVKVATRNTGYSTGAVASATAA